MTTETRKRPTRREDGDGWIVDTFCRTCRTAMILRSDERPNDAALRFAAIAVCATCADEMDKAERRRKVEAETEARIHRAKLPHDLAGLKFDAMEGDDGGPRSKAIAAVRAWSRDHKSRGVCLFGDPGTGKTRLAATGAWARLQRFPVRWISVPNLMAQVGAYGDDGRREAIRTLTGRGPLVLDDLDKVNPSEWSRAQLFTAIDARVAAGAPMLITTNLPPSKLGEKFGTPIVSRIVGACDVYELAGRDRRLFTVERAD